MLYTASEYSKVFTCGHRKVSAKTVIRRGKSGLLPHGHHCKKLTGRTGTYVIEVKRLSKLRQKST